jgi:hypothetical protein
MGWKAVEKLAEVLLAQAAADGSGSLVHDVLEQEQEGASLSADEGAEGAAEQGAQAGVQPRLRDSAPLLLPAAHLPG